MYYDFIFVGGGMAGLSLLYRMLDEPSLRQKSILVLDKVKKSKNDRTWSFWTDQPTAFDDIVFREWQQVQIISDTFSLELPLKKMRYKTIRGIDFYGKVQEKTTRFPNVTFAQVAVKAIQSEGSQVVVTGEDGQTFSAGFVFDSRYTPELAAMAKASSFYILQHFKGWVIETNTPQFNADQITMFDFRTPQPDGLYFFYTLPFSPTTALVEYTVFSPQLLGSQTAYQTPLKSYIEDQLGIKEYKIKEEEYGVIPMSNYAFKRQPAERILRLGVAGGQAKPSTGYAFLRAQRDAKAIISGLKKGDFTFAERKTKPHFLLYDTLLLDILARDGKAVKPLFEQLFRNNPIERLLSFLDERTKFHQDLRVMASVAPLPFLVSVQRWLKRQMLQRS